jgi:hypothetical protein
MLFDRPRRREAALRHGTADFKVFALVPRTLATKPYLTLLVLVDGLPKTLGQRGRIKRN